MGEKPSRAMKRETSANHQRLGEGEAEFASVITDAQQASGFGHEGY
jgi:hypothetical protein